MLYMLWGLLAGIIFSFFPVLGNTSALEIHPQWYGSLPPINSIEPSIDNSTSIIELPPINTSEGLFWLSGNGKLLNTIESNDKLFSASWGSKYFVQYYKVGTDVELLNPGGERFWKIRSREYPHISFNGKIILLLNGNQSKVRILDYNGNEVGVKKISGRLCTTISFSKYSDYFGIGFLDGSYYIANEKGEVVYNRIVQGSVIKGIAINSSGTFAAVHYGSNKADSISVINLIEKEENTFKLKNIHKTRIALFAEQETVVVIDYDRIIFLKDGELEKSILIPPAASGESSIDYSRGLYSAAYRGIDNRSRFFLIQNGAVLKYKEFPLELYLKVYMDENIIFLRGSQGLYCYSFARLELP